ncbi:hypothetical protein PFHG_05033 [Plasmodium falciparum HB3]|uniref:Plasmodium falciparum erythrocyte membrane protein 1 acidic terminal segment domain-containing protein n=1 Tax=Plasmodium falciparum (isolate HB3) TaxID=137071 RepID=A0A0L7KJQ5_PLAFX|nr:hypothetical protein PFHG_05033 [Plasmodium falciparum HB3]
MENKTYLNLLYNNKIINPNCQQFVPNILEIPKGNYDIPKTKSSNRYIPYCSRSKRWLETATIYKGKTYIYVEGDQSDDYSYIGDISLSDKIS